MVFLQDSIVGSVVDSHYRAWLYTAPLAGAMSLAGSALSVWAMRRRARVFGAAIFAVVWNGLPLGVFLISLSDRRF